MRSRMALAGLATGAAALAAGIAAPSAFAATPPTSSLGFTITSPIVANMGLSASSVALVEAGPNANISAATASPATVLNSQHNQYTGGVEIAVSTDDPNGFSVTLNGSAGGLQVAGGGSVDWYDMNIDTFGLQPNGTTIPTQVTTDNHFTSAAGADPTTNGVKVFDSATATGANSISDITSPSGATVGQNASPIDSVTGVQESTLMSSYYVNPNTGFIPGHDTTGTASFTFLGK